MPVLEQKYPDLQFDTPLTEGSARDYEARKVLYEWTRHILRQRYTVGRPPHDVPADAGDFQVYVNSRQFDMQASEAVKVASVLGALLGEGAWRQFLEDLDANDLAQPTAWDHLSNAADAKYAKLVADIAQPLSVHNGHEDLFKVVYDVLFENGKNGLQGGTRYIKLQHLWKIGSRLVDDGVSAKHPHVQVMIERQLDYVVKGALEGNAAAIEIDLPDLEAGTAYDIRQDNVNAVAAIYFTAMLEDLKLFSVANTVAEHFMTGMLPLSRGNAGERLYKWLKDAPDRFNEVERRSIYGRTLGMAQGGTDVLPNREFSELWVRFLSTVSLLNRDMFSAGTRKVSSEQAQKSARDLAVNLSLHGYGVAHFAAVEMQKLVREVLDLLAHPEILKAYGVNDVWQLVERVGSLYLGGSVNGVRFRTMAQSGSKIILWLGQHASQLSSVSTGTIDFLANDELVNHVERWLAVTGTTDSTVEQYTDPVVINDQPLIPSLGMGGSQGLSNMVQQTLDNVGVNLPDIPQA